MELSLDLSFVYVPKTISELLREVSKIENNSVRLSKLDDYVKRLDDEMKKIDAFKRELPLCMLLISDAIEMLKMEVIKCKRSSDGSVSVMGDFTPLKADAAGEEDKGADFVNNESNKKDWLSSVQLWTDTTTKTTVSDQKQQDNTISQLKLRTEEEDLSSSENSIHLGECGSRGGAFVPYKGESYGSVRTELKKPQDITRFPELSLRRSINELGSCNPRLKNNESGRIGSGSSLLQTESHQQTSRKQRRCWSPDLHRRFIDALQQLGGSQVATPKQIRELMRVDGITNDEVKSHLQKYRLHIRKVPNAATGPMDGLWTTTQDGPKDNTKLKISESGSPQGPLPVRGPGVKGISISCNTSMDAEEDEKSDGSNWRGGPHRPSEVDV